MNSQFFVIFHVIIKIVCIDKSYPELTAAFCCFFRFLCYNKCVNTYGGAIPMAYVISGACISCGSCAGECPVGAIAEGDGKYEINADACIDCGTCAGSCPVGAISQG